MNRTIYLDIPMSVWGRPIAGLILRVLASVLAVLICRWTGII